MPRLAGDPAPDPPAVPWAVTHPQILRTSALLAVEAVRDGSVSELAALLEATSAFVEAGGSNQEGGVAAVRRVAELALVFQDSRVGADHPMFRRFADGSPAGRTAEEEDDDVRLRTALADADANHDVLESQARYGVIPQRLVSVVQRGERDGIAGTRSRTKPIGPGWRPPRLREATASERTQETTCGPFAA
jgi:hypothetical protein